MIQGQGAVPEARSSVDDTRSGIAKFPKDWLNAARLSARGRTYDRPVTAAMQTLRVLLLEQDRLPCRRTFERRLAALPATLPAQIGCLGRYLVAELEPWLAYARAAAIDKHRPACAGRRLAQEGP